jgi:hypothetical protein
MDLTDTLAPKSNQLNSDDLIVGPKTITVTKVTAGNSEQPVAIGYEGDQGKPWYPCKSMRRVLVAAWGADASAYIGRSITLFRDPEVSYGGIKVGGIRISHLSDLDSPLSIALTVTRQKRAPYKVQPLKVTPPAPPAPAPATDPVAAAAEVCRRAGLTPDGIECLCLEISKGALDALADLQPKILTRLAQGGVSPETVKRCNEAARARHAKSVIDEADPPPTEELPALWGA